MQSISIKPLDAQRFWSTVEKTDSCWLWKGSKRPNGYGQFFVAMPGKKLSVSTHRYSYLLHFGEIPDGLCVLHKCDVRYCIRPDHLWLGTQGDNNRDAVRKGRHVSGLHLHPERSARGIFHPWAKMTDGKVRLMRTLANCEYLSSCTLAKWFNLNHKTVESILKRKTWAHVSDVSFHVSPPPHGTASTATPS